ncbi:hypothetical protein BKI51_02580 [Alphaproteobacteria bacterium AO1-B]|nr:hypothetical protein BKI51_02580 [Alphaproteobacteria bacterium AO1-B]
MEFGCGARGPERLSPTAQTSAISFKSDFANPLYRSSDRQHLPLHLRSVEDDGIGAVGTTVQGSNRTSLNPSVPTIFPNSMVLHVVTRQALPTAPTGVSSDVGTMILQNGFSGVIDNAGSALGDFVAQEAADI